MAGPRTGDFRLPAADKDRQRRVWADGLRDLGRNGPPCERVTGVDAGYKCEREQALAFEYGQDATTLMRVKPRSLWRAARILGGGVCCRTEP